MRRQRQSQELRIDEQGKACSWSEPTQRNAQGCLMTSAKMAKMPAINSTEIST
jgi:hypothetical protein